MKNIKQKGSILTAVLLVGAIILAAFGFSSVSDQGKVIDSQNVEILELKQAVRAQDELILGAAFRPSNYTGKLLTRLNEGGAESTFATTPGIAKDGSTLTTAKIGDFIVITVNPGAANEEKISASAVSVSGTTATWTIANRGLSFTATSSVTANKKQHAIGETVIISDDDHFLSTQYAALDDNITITGSWSFPNPTVAQNAATKAYVDGTVFGGIGGASETATGTVEIATAVEIGSSTINGGSGRLAIPASLASSTYNIATAAGIIPVTQSNGKIDSNFVGTTTLFATSSIYNSPIGLLGKNIQVFTSSSTFSVPTGVRYVRVRMVGGGRGGEAEDGGANTGGFGGSGGWYAEGIIDITGSSSVAVVVGQGGTGGLCGGGNITASPTDGATSTVASLITASGGNAPGLGTGSLGSLLVPGGKPGLGSNISIAGSGSPTSGGRSHWGQNTAITAGNTNATNASTSVDGYGTGGAGGRDSGSDCNTGGNGANGLVILDW